jgi:hypothetical protein
VPKEKTLAMLPRKKSGALQPALPKKLKQV